MFLFLNSASALMKKLYVAINFSVPCETIFNIFTLATQNFTQAVGVVRLIHSCFAGFTIKILLLVLTSSFKKYL